MNLQTIHELLLNEPFDAIFEPADDEVPADRVTIRLTIDDLPGPLYLQLLLVPQQDSSEPEDVIQLQFFSPFPVTVDAAHQSDLIGYLPFLNVEAPIMGFNYNPFEQFVYFRHTALLPGGEAAHRAVVETVWLVYFTLDNLAAGVAALAMGQVGLLELLDLEEE